MAETMIDKMAKAICRAIVEQDSAEAQFAAQSGPRPERIDIDIEGDIEEQWKDYIPAAQAALAVVRKELTAKYTALSEKAADRPA